MNRTGRLTPTQVEAFVRYLEKNPDLVRGRPKTTEGNQLTRVQWHELAKKLNGMDGGVVKSSKAWSKYWADKKCVLKKVLQKQKRNAKLGTVGDETRFMSPLDMRLLTLLCTIEREDLEDPMPTLVAKEEVTQEMDDSDGLQSPPGSPLSPGSPGSQRSSPTISDEEIPLPLPSPTPALGTVKAERLRYPRRGPKWVRRPARSTLQIEWNRLAAMEERRVEAEHMVAKAQKESSAALMQCAAAVEMLAGAVRSQGTEIADALRCNGQMVAEALQAQGAAIAEALRRRGDS